MLNGKAIVSDGYMGGIDWPYVGRHCMDAAGETAVGTTADIVEKGKFCMIRLT